MATTRKFIIHNVPITAEPVMLPLDPKTGRGGYLAGWLIDLSVCLSNVRAAATCPASLAVRSVSATIKLDFY